MLRSSKEGRKQAARYHAAQTSIPSIYDQKNLQRPNNSLLPLNISQRPSTFGAPSRSPSTTQGQSAEQRQQSKTFTAKQDESILSSTKDANIVKVHLQQASPVKGGDPSASNNNEHLSSLPTRSFLLEARSKAMPSTPSEEATSIASTNVAVQWSRETSIDSASLDTSLSSHTSSRAMSDVGIMTTEEAKRKGIEQWENESDTGSSALTEIDSPPAGLLANWSSHDTAFGANDEPLSSPLSSHQHHLERNTPSISSPSSDATRPRRTISKTIKQLEAEETMSLTPRHRNHRASTSRSSLSSQPMTPKREAHIYSVQPVAESSMSAPQTPLIASSTEVKTDRATSIVASPSSLTRSGKKRGRPKGTTKQFLLERRRAFSRAKEHSASMRSSSLVYPTVIGDDVETVSRRDGSLDSPSLSSFPPNVGLEKVERPAWKRKLFLTSGLYSKDHKMDEIVKAPSRKEFLTQQKDLLQHGTARTRAVNRTSAFPMPTDYGYWMLTEKRDFRLSYPIAQEMPEIREKMATKKKPPPYKQISQNRYVSRPKLPGEIMICQCPPSGTCDESCVNRQTQYLCHPKFCPCGERCTNIQFGKRKPVKTEVQWYGPRGFGLKTLEPIAKDSFIDEYRGEVISYNEMVWRVRDHYKDTGNYYFLMYDAPAGEMLDGGLKGNITRFANHSCDSNCKIQKWLICGTDEQRAGEFQVALFAARDIAAGEELTYDYGWSAFSPKSMTGENGAEGEEACHCGAANCSGIMGRKALSSSTTVKSSSSLSKGRKKVKRRRRRIARLLGAASALNEAKAIDALKDDKLASTSLMPAPFVQQDPKNDVSVAMDVVGEAPPSVEPGSKLHHSKRKRSTSLTTRPSIMPGNSMDVVPQSEKEAKREAISSAKTARQYVRDRVTFGVQIPSQLIDSNNIEVVEGKRKRKPLVPFAVTTSDESDKKVKKRRTIKIKTKAETPADADATWLTVDSSFSSTAPNETRRNGETSVATAFDEEEDPLANLSFDIAQYPPGTKFYTRKGDEFDFSVYSQKRRGKKPRPYTKEELEAADNRHRINLQRLNDLRKFK